MADPNSKPQPKKSSWKWSLIKIRESRRIRKWKEGFGEVTETSRGGFLIGSLSPLGVRFPPQELKVTLKLRMMIRTPYPVSDNQDYDAVGLNYTARYSHGSRREALSETHSRLCIWAQFSDSLQAGWGRLGVRCEQQRLFHKKSFGKCQLYWRKRRDI